MDILKVRNEMRLGKSVYQIPLRVTFYARVSTDKYEQQSSLENQVQYYTDSISQNEHWKFVSGYIDEGISGTSTNKRNSFNRMISDAKAGMFDLIITKEISRFSRSTLDSIKYTQELLEHNVGVLFQNDNINTLDSDSEFRLVVMAGVAQDEVRKLSERLKFGFRQSIKNGRVLGNDKLWGYDKQGCALTINEEEAETVRLIFSLYVNEKMGLRRLSQRLMEYGITSREGNEFNTSTIRNMLNNPKYKGWYCGNKSKSIDYRKKKNIALDKDEWVMYPDPSIPAIVSEELWDQAYEQLHSRGKLLRQSGAVYNNRYPYSGKIICEEHGTSFHRQVIPTESGGNETWQCRVYRQKGRAGCTAPILRTTELDVVMAETFSQVVEDKDKIIDNIIRLITSVADSKDYKRELDKCEKDEAAVRLKKDRLLELNLDGAINRQEFIDRNENFNRQLHELQQKIAELQEEEARNRNTRGNLEKIKIALQKELNFEDGINSELVSAIVEQIIVKKTDDRKHIKLDIKLRVGQALLIEYVRGKKGEMSFRDECLRNITQPYLIRTTSFQ